MFVTVTEGRVAPEREDDLRSAWEETASAPAGLIQSTLVRGEDGTWRIITFWESRDAVMAMRASGEPPALTMVSPSWITTIGVDGDRRTPSQGLMSLERTIG